MRSYASSQSEEASTISMQPDARSAKRLCCGTYPSARRAASSGSEANGAIAMAAATNIAP
jgi:hypothetical protein